MVNLKIIIYRNGINNIPIDGNIILYIKLILMIRIIYINENKIMSIILKIMLLILKIIKIIRNFVMIMIMIIIRIVKI